MKVVKYVFDKESKELRKKVIDIDELSEEEREDYFSALDTLLKEESNEASFFFS